MRFALLLLTAPLSIAGDFTTSLGDANPYTVSAITADAAGNTYVVGSRALGGLAVGGVGFGGILSLGAELTLLLGASSDIFISKLDATGKLLFTDTFAGKGVDSGSAIAVDPSGNIYIAGTTTSPDFPLSKALQTQPNTTYGTGFIIKLSNDGSTILYSTYFGGTLGGTSINSLATDANGNLYLTGITTAGDFPHTSGMPLGPLANVGSGAILASISAAGDKIIYSGVLPGGFIPVQGGGTMSTGGVGVAVDAAGNAYFAGNTSATSLPTTQGVLQPAGSFTGFLAKVNAASTNLTYLTYLPNLASTLAVDALGSAYVAGYTHQGINGPTQASVAKINPSGGAIVWTNNLGGSADSIRSVAVDAGGNVWATGSSYYSTSPNTNGWTTGPEFLVGLNSTGTKLSYSALYPSGTVAQSVAVDPSGLVHVAGQNGFVSAIAPNAAPSMKIFGFENAAGSSVTARISPAEVISIYGPGIGPSTATSAPLSGKPGSFFYPKTVAGVQVTINGMDMPLLYVSANQINAVVPMELAPGAAATVRVTNGTSVSPDYPVWIVAATAQAFPTVLNQDFTINSQTHPAKAGTAVTFYVTGWQSNFSPLADGQVATTAQDACHGTCQLLWTNVTNPIGVPAARVLYGGAAPDIVAGVSQINVRLDAIPPPATQMSLVVIGPSSVAQSVWVTP